MFSALGMLVAIVAALLDQGIVDFTWIVAGMLVGGAIVVRCGPMFAGEKGLTQGEQT